jgi:hypothetical protein
MALVFYSNDEESEQPTDGPPASFRQPLSIRTAAKALADFTIGSPKPKDRSTAPGSSPPGSRSCRIKEALIVLAMPGAISAFYTP